LCAAFNRAGRCWCERIPLPGPRQPRFGPLRFGLPEAWGGAAPFGYVFWVSTSAAKTITLSE
jgi:hypothetical protein